MSITPSPEDEPVPIRQLLTYPVIISLTNYLSIDFLYCCHSSLLPLFFTMPIELGGVGLDPIHIGSILGGYRTLLAIFMATSSSRLIHYLGERRAFVLGIICAFVMWTIVPFINLYARHFGFSKGLWGGIALLVVPMCGVEMAYGESFTFDWRRIKISDLLLFLLRLSMRLYLHNCSSSE
jgi:hypothetical protein